MVVYVDKPVEKVHLSGSARAIVSCSHRMSPTECPGPEQVSNGVGVAALAVTRNEESSKIPLL